MDEILSNYADLRYLFENVEVEANPFHLAAMNSNYHDVRHIPPMFCHTRFQHNILHLNI